MGMEIFEDLSIAMIIFWDETSGSDWVTAETLEVSVNGTTPVAGCFFFWGGKSIYKWMMTGGRLILGNPHIPN